MSEAIAGINLNAAAEALREKIRLSFVELIPKEKWDELIQLELKRFFTNTVTRNAYDGRETVNPSPFAQIVRAELETYVKGAVKEQLSSPEYQAGYMGNGLEVSAAVKEYMASHHKEIVEAAVAHLFGSGIQQVLEMAKYR